MTLRRKGKTVCRNFQRANKDRSKSRLAQSTITEYMVNFLKTCIGPAN
jgi:hypothetical protein